MAEDNQIHALNSAYSNKAEVQSLLLRIVCRLSRKPRLLFRFVTNILYLSARIASMDPLIH